MASRAGLSGLALAEIAAGVILAWSGIQNQSLTNTLKPLIGGKAPTPGPAGSAGTIPGASTPESGTGANQVSLTTPGSGTDHANMLLGQLMAGGYGWATGAQWTALNHGWGDLESSWNANAKNPSSGAYGIAQALGHGNSATQGTQSNMYGPVAGMNFSNATYVAANSGSATAQIAWGLKYLSITYPGGPDTVPGWTGGGGYVGY